MDQGLDDVWAGKCGRVSEGWPVVCLVVVGGVLWVMFHSWPMRRHENLPPRGPEK